MTPWQIGGIAFGLMVYAVAWVRGGPPERLAAGVMIFTCLVSSLTYQQEIDGFDPFPLAEDSACLLIFGWLCLRADRWWTLVVTATLALIVFVDVARLLNPAVTQYALASARVGMWYLIDLTLLLSVCERRLAGEPPAGRAAWEAADRATAARRGRSPERREPWARGHRRALEEQATGDA